MSTVANELQRGRPTGRPRAPFLADSVIDATIDLLAVGGVEAATIDAIAARAGVGKPSIYRRWSSRDELINEVLLRITERAVPIPDSGSLREDLLSLLNDFIALMSTSLGQASVALAAYAVSHPELGANAGASPIAIRREQTKVVIERAIRRGELPKKTSADLILDQVSAAVYMQLLVWRRPVLELNAPAIVDLILLGAIPR